jgi:hypothetical protein
VPAAQGECCHELRPVVWRRMMPRQSQTRKQGCLNTIF